MPLGLGGFGTSMLLFLLARYCRRQSRPPSQSWRTFLANHAQAISAADLFVVQTLTFQALYVIFFISHGRRQLVHLELTVHPTPAWVWRSWSKPHPGTATLLISPDADLVGLLEGRRVAFDAQAGYCGAGKRFQLHQVSG